MIKNLAKEYRAQLKEFMAGGGETSLRNAYLLGRQALEQGLGVLDITVVHHQVLATLLKHTDASPRAVGRTIKEGSRFLAECLAPFEMAQRGFRESIFELNSLNARLEGEVEKRTQALRESELRYRSLIEISPDAITMTDLQGNVILSNQQSAQMHGFASPEELVGVHLGGSVERADMEKVQAMAHRILQEGPGAISTLEYSLCRQDGTTVPVEVRVTLLCNAAGEPIGFVGINRDISDRKHAQEKFEAWARWQAAVAAVSQRALSGVDLATLFHEAVGVVAESLGLEYCELLELLPEGDRLVLRDGVGWKQGLIGSALIGAGKDSQEGYTLLQAGPVVVEDLPHESRFTPPAFLTDHNVLAGMTVIINSKDRPYGILGAHTCQPRQFTPVEINLLQSIANVLAMAIDNRRMLEVEARARQRAEQDSERWLRVLAIVSHELRTPLTSIKGFASTLLAEDVVWDIRQQRDFIHTIDEEADKLSGLIAQLLDFSKMQAGVFVLLPARHSPASLVAAATAHLRELASRHALEVDVPDALPDVNADPQRVGQVLENLVENAAKYAPQGTSIRISARAREKFVEISVADEGPGIPVQERENIFQPFYRTSDALVLKAKGAGLGLTICRGMIEAQGGRIWVGEQPGLGARICFTLPVADFVERPSD